MSAADAADAVLTFNYTVISRNFRRSTAIKRIQLIIYGDQDLLCLNFKSLEKLKELSFTTSQHSRWTRSGREFHYKLRTQTQDFQRKEAKTGGDSKQLLKTKPQAKLKWNKGRMNLVTNKETTRKTTTTASAALMIWQMRGLTAELQVLGGLMS